MVPKQHAASRLESIANWILVVAAVGIAVSVIHREIAARSTAASAQQSKDLRFMKEWQALDARAVPFGDTTGTVKLYEFGDLECPACRVFHLNTVSTITEKYRNRVSIRFLHFPLSSHSFAKPAAIAAECADQQGRFSQFVHAVYSQQDSLGLKSWGAYAAAAGVSDTLTFAKCSHTPTFARIDSGLALARRLALQGTPTIIVNGWQFPVPPQPELLSTVIDEIIAGRDPKTAYQAAR